MESCLWFAVTFAVDVMLLLGFLIVGDDLSEVCSINLSSPDRDPLPLALYLGSPPTLPPPSSSCILLVVVPSILPLQVAVTFLSLNAPKICGNRIL
jgi:hypothetical protein